MRLIADTHLFATSGDCLVVTLEHGNQLVDKGLACGKDTFALIAHLLFEYVEQRGVGLFILTKQ